MSLNFFDGFDSYDDAAQMAAAGWTTQAGTPTFSLTNGRFGGGCLELDGTDAVDITGITTGSALEDYTAGLSIRFSAWPTSGTAEFLQFRAASGRLLSLTISSTGVLSTIDQSSATGGSHSLVLNTWYRIEVNALLNSNSAGTVDVQVNGSNVISLTGRDTNVSGGFIGMRLASAASAAFRVDDFTYVIGDATAPTSFLGDVRVDNLRPDGDGAATDWTANTGTRWEAVDDPLGTSDGDTTYIADTTVANDNTFTLTNVVGTATTTHAFQIRALARKTDAGAINFRGIAVNNSVEAVGVTVGPTETYAWTRLGIFTTNPDGGGALSDSVMNSMLAGVEIV